MVDELFGEAVMIFIFSTNGESIDSEHNLQID